MLRLLYLWAAVLGAQTADLAVVNANIYTVDPAQPRASALAVRDGRFLAVGNDVQAHIGPNTRVIDAGGATLIPGFIDSHGHMEGLGESLEILDLREAVSADEVVQKVAAAVSGTPPGGWIRGRAWDQTRWPGRQFPDADQLSAVSPDHPVFLTRVDGHAAWVNRKALEIAGVTAATPDPPGGKIHHDADGRPTGILIDRAQNLVRAKIPPATPDQVRERLARAAAECSRFGLTEVHDAGIPREVLDAYRDLIAADRLPLRVYAMIGGEGELWKEYLARGPELGDLLTVRSIKLISDGALGSRGAACRLPTPTTRQPRPD